MNDENTDPSNEQTSAQAEHWVTIQAKDLRTAIESLKEGVLNLERKFEERPPQTEEDRSEQVANVMLAYRHLEDAKMRIGKVIQATEGKSVYDK